ncbi:hypothetical protein [Eubacterium aggregans]|uniref:Uncharacterized protein n=1 Tax=Eubacterium aggregans TaxID=81409 RepID=A0A1H4ATY6_9FIRM|nr:hypothetical protein [Eubacterium aggregans]MDD4690971.1 hypothetical protein [Eubacterium aggregans]SEA39415.1 hypothetical protein SAMN04515656_10941 [Eubacterium aggregans]
MDIECLHRTKGQLTEIKEIPTIIPEEGEPIPLVSIREMSIVHLPGFGEMVRFQDHSGHPERIVYLGVALVYNADGSAVSMDRQTREIEYELKRRIVKGHE